MFHPQILSAQAARFAFPRVVGHVTGGEFVSPRASIVFQGPGAFSVLIDGQFRACCPDRGAAVAFIAKEGA